MIREHGFACGKSQSEKLDCDLLEALIESSWAGDSTGQRPVSTWRLAKSEMKGTDRTNSPGTKQDDTTDVLR